MRAIDPEMIEYRDDVVARARLGVLALVVGRVGERIAAGVIRDAAVAAREKPYLRLPAAVVPRELVHEDQGGAAARFLVIEPDTVVRGRVRHSSIRARQLQHVLGKIAEHEVGRDRRDLV